MVSVTALWLPILLSAVFVFIVSSIIHMVLSYHESDFAKISKEDEVRGALGKFMIPPGDYMIPRAQNQKEMNSPEFIAKMNEGPVVIMTVLKNGPMAIGESLIQWFAYSIVVGIFAAYITGQAVKPGAHYLEVFQFAGCMAFAGYSLALLQNSIWFKRGWSATFKSMADGLVYALVTAGTFGWLWP